MTLPTLFPTVLLYKRILPRNPRQARQARPSFICRDCSADSGLYRPNPGVPVELISAARAMAGERPDDFLWVEPGSLPTDITLKVEGEEPLAEWLYVVAAPFATLEDDIADELEELWSSAETAERRCPDQ